jgi:hypothetical protein
VAWQGTKDFADDVSLLAMEVSAHDAEETRPR